MNNLKTPVYVIDEAKLQKNCEILKEIEDKSGARILLAQKAFSGYSTYPLVAEYRAGTTSSGLFEAKLAYEEFYTDEQKMQENENFERFSAVLSNAVMLMAKKMLDFKK